MKATTVSAINRLIGGSSRAMPLVYSVLNRAPAQLRPPRTGDWNSTREDAEFSDYVTRFEIDHEFAARYDVELAGGEAHQELWVPAEELAEFNRHIVGKIEVVAEYGKGERLK